MSEFLLSLETAFQQYIIPCLSGMAFALIAALGVLLFFSCCWSAGRPRRGSLDWVALRERRPQSFQMPCHPMEKRDGLPLLLITLVYAFTAFFQLGAFQSPQSALDLGSGKPVVLDLGTSVELAGIRYLPRLGTGSYHVEVSPDGDTWYALWARRDEEGAAIGYYWAEAGDYTPSYALPQRYSDLFKWLDVEVDNPQTVRYLRLTGRADKDLLELSEVGLYDPNGVLVSPGAGVSPLFDEQRLIPDSPSWYNSAFFDEIYHARTALEHIDGVYPYEVSHPPLGKLIIGLGIRLFGMTPFGWRLMGTLFGVLMLPILYVFLKNLFGKTPVAACGTALFAFDFMHLTQTRIATIDTYSVFFILLMYFFLYRYLTLPPGASFRQWGWPLFLSGLFWGLGAASKWTVIYAAVGLAAAYFIGLFFKLRAWPADMPGKLPWLIRLLAFSVLCFVLLPVCIYCLSYLPYAQAKGDASLRGLLEVVVQNQTFMFTYHEGVTATHPYSSRWFQWIVDARPILYYLDSTTGAGQGLKSAFGCFNNPVVCWAGLLAVLTLLIQPVASLLELVTRPLRLLMTHLPTGKRVLCENGPVLPSLRPDRRGVFILIGYLSQLVPWMFIGRTTFEYHYFPSTLFLVLAIAYVMNGLIERRPSAWRGPVYGLTAGAVGLYAAFYPVLIGLMVPVWYTSTFLRWFPSWPF